MVDSPAGMVNSDVYPSPCAGGGAAAEKAAAESAAEQYLANLQKNKLAVARAVARVTTGKGKEKAT
eukprot:1191076-Prorocentrum_minimum.AAC.1